MPANLIGIFGVITILAIAVAFSSNRKAIRRCICPAGWPGGNRSLFALGPTGDHWHEQGRARRHRGVLAVIGFSRAGIDMVFGPLADTDIIGFSFAINVLPIIIFFAALMSVLYHLGMSVARYTDLSAPALSNP
jgi:CNT family concentrative nucleoside transporter